MWASHFGCGWVCVSVRVCVHCPEFVCLPIGSCIMHNLYTRFASGQQRIFGLCCRQQYCHAHTPSTVPRLLSSPDFRCTLSHSRQIKVDNQYMWWKWWFPIEKDAWIRIVIKVNICIYICTINRIYIYMYTLNIHFNYPLFLLKILLSTRQQSQERKPTQTRHPIPTNHRVYRVHCCTRRQQIWQNIT